MLFDSMITFRACSSFLRRVGRASARRPCSVRTQKTGAAPADRNREVSELPERSCSSEIAQEWSAVAQSQASPFAEQIPWPYCVILMAVHWNSGKAEIRLATTLVLPTLRECPPITTNAIRETPSQTRLESKLRSRCAGSEGEKPLRQPAGCRRYPSIFFRQARQRRQLP